MQGFDLKAASVLGLFNTGVDADGNVLGIGQADPHYVLSWVGSGARAVARNPIWAYAPAGSAWIGCAVANDPLHLDPVGDYYYELSMSLDLSGIATSGLQLTGSWATDNSAEMWLNGTYTGFSKGELGFYNLDAFSIGSGFVEGLNTLEFRVNNAGLFNGQIQPNPSGLLVAGLHMNISSGADPMPVPEGMQPTVIIFGVVFLTLLFLRHHDMPKVSLLPQRMNALGDRARS